jgi:urocanate hydratase
VIVGLNENIPEYEYWKVIWSSSLGCFRIVNLSNDDETDLYMLDRRFVEIIRNEFDEPGYIKEWLG